MLRKKPNRPSFVSFSYLKGKTPCDIIGFTSLVIDFLCQTHSIILLSQGQGGFSIFFMIDQGLALARGEAIRAGFDEALMLDVNGCEVAPKHLIGMKLSTSPRHCWRSCRYDLCYQSNRGIGLNGRIGLTLYRMRRSAVCLEHSIWQTKVCSGKDTISMLTPEPTTSLKAKGIRPWKDDRLG